MADQEFLGSALYAEWVYSGGTVVLSADYRTFTFTPGKEFVDVTAGADTARKELDSFANPTCSFESLAQYGGTANLAALAEGTQGTLVFGEAGTATGRPKTTMPAKSEGVTRNGSYDGAVTWGFAFRSYGSAPTYATW